MDYGRLFSLCRRQQISKGLILPTACGLAALALVAASALAPWFEWSFGGGVEPGIGRTDLWGPPACVAGSPCGSVEMEPAGRRAVDVAVGVYLAALLVGMAWVVPVLRAVAGQLGPRRAVLFVGGGSLLLGAAAVVAAGLPWFLLKRAVVEAALQSTWVVPVALLRPLPHGPALLAVGVLLGVVAAGWALRAPRNSA